MRSRNLKPGFFSNELLAEIPPCGRILFAGLWCVADREGRLEDRPRRLKAELLPYDDVDVDDLLGQLATRGFIERYEVDGDRYIEVNKFLIHQSPNAHEVKSAIPPPLHMQGNASICKHINAPLNPESRILNPESGITTTRARAIQPAQETEKVDSSFECGLRRKRCREAGYTTNEIELAFETMRLQGSDPAQKPPAYILKVCASIRAEKDDVPSAPVDRLAMAHRVRQRLIAEGKMKEDD